MLLTSSLTSVLTALSSYVWPLIAAIVLAVLMPTIKKVLATRSYSIKVGGLDVTVQEASQNLQKQISDLQTELSALKLHTSSPGVAGSTARSAPPEATAHGAGFASILWVDDELVNVAYEISILQSRGVSVSTAASTEEALGKLASAQAVVSDSARKEDGQFNPRAGIELISEVHKLNPDLPVFLYTLASIAERIAPDAMAAGAAGVYSSSVEIIARLGPPPDR